MSGVVDETGALEAEQAAAVLSRPTIEALFRQHGRDVCRIVRRLVGPRASEADVDDLCQQVFLAAHKDLPRFRGDSAPRTWLYGIATRVVLMHFRSWRRRLAALAAFADATRMTETPPPTAEATFADREQLMRVSRALDSIKPEKRVVFVLHEVEGLAGKEIAAILGIPEATVFTRLYYARRELVTALKKVGEP
jgi:RNA polymerase sigma-70 factor, ECF subfamily